MVPVQTTTERECENAAVADIAAHEATSSIRATAAQRHGSVRLFGCQIDRVRMPQAVDRAYGLIADRGACCQYVVTPNVDHVVMLQHHRPLRRAYQRASLVLADGMPVVLASRLLGRALPERVTGADLTMALFDEAESRGGLRVFLLGALPGVAAQAAIRISEQWPAVEIVGINSPPLGFEKDAVQNADILEQISVSRPDVVVVGLGAPKQELWVHAHRHQIDAALALCVGATIDFLAGNKSRAPRWMRKSGLEWLHRVATEPRRLLGRYLRDAWHFPRIVWREWNNSRNGAKRQRTRLAAAFDRAESTGLLATSSEHEKG